MWLGSEVIQFFLGGMWLLMLIGFVIFAYNYFYYYRMGVLKGDKSCFLT